MPDYSKSKIYKIVCNITGLVYIGSTTQTLSQRLQDHKVDYKRYLNKKFSCVTSFKIIENNNYEIILIEDCPCERKEQLLSRERFWIENTECVNLKIPSRTQKEYREENREKIKQINKEYHENNKEKRKEYCEKNKEKIKEQRKEYWEKNKEKLREQRKEYCEKNKEKLREQIKEHRENNYEYIIKREKAYREKNKEKINERQKIYRLKKKILDENIITL
jgi:hypothetical protein